MNGKKQEPTANGIAEFCRRCGGGVTFVELLREFNGTGDCELGYCSKNIIFWQGVSPTLADAIADATRDNLIVMRQSTILVYTIDGGLLSLPLATQNRTYSKPHWLPVVFDAMPVPEKQKTRRGKK